MRYILSILVILLFTCCKTNEESKGHTNPYYEGLFVNEQDMELLTKLNNGKVLGIPNVMIIKIINEKEALMVSEIVDKTHIRENLQRIYTKLSEDKDYMETQRKQEWVRDLTYEWKTNDSIIFREGHKDYVIYFSGKIINNEVGLRINVTLPDSMSKIYTPSFNKDAEIKKFKFYPVKAN